MTARQSSGQQIYIISLSQTHFTNISVEIVTSGGDISLSQNSNTPQSEMADIALALSTRQFLIIVAGGEKTKLMVPMSSCGQSA